MPRSALTASYSRRELMLLFVLFLAYTGTAVLGSYLFRTPAVIFPAVAVALSGLILGGVRLWPAIFFGSLAGSIINDAPLIWTIGLAIGHSIQAVTGAALLTYLRFDPVFRRVRDMLAYMGVAAVISTILPSLGTIILVAHQLYSGSTTPSSVSWWTWWIGLLTSYLLFGAGIVRWFAKPRFTRTRFEWLELAMGFMTVAILSYLVYWTNLSQLTSGILVLLYLVPFVWFTLRLGMRATVLVFAMTTAIAVTGAFWGDTASTQPLGQRLVTLEVWLSTLAAIFYLFVAMVEERQRAARELNAQLARVHSLLEETKREDRAKSDFIAVFAHELRNPLAPIVSSVELLRLKWANDASLAPVIDTLEDRAKTIVRLLDDLLDVSRISQKRLKLRLEDVDLTDSLQRVVSAMAPLAQKHHLRLSFYPTERMYVSVDPVRFEQILTNLLMNAIKYTDSGGRITVATEKRGETARIMVRDTGVGIPEDMLQHIFTPFVGLGVEHRQQSIKEGIGIGLSLTQQLVELHGGTIEAKSEGNMRGSEFTVTLPLTASQPQTIINPTSTSMIHHTSQKMRILVVDDNEAAAHGLGTLLRHVGNDVDFAYVGNDVAFKVDEFKPDVIVLDIGLPDMSGYEVAEKLRLNGYQGRIIALTGYGQEEDKRKAQAAGFDTHLTKPVGIADLQAVLMPQGA